MRRPLPVISRWGLALVLSLGLVAWPGAGARAQSGPPAAPTQGVRDLVEDAQKLLDAGKSSEALSLFDEALNLARKQGDRPGRVLAARALAKAHRMSGQLEEAQMVMGEAVTATSDLGDKTLQGAVLREAADIETRLGQSDRALGMLKEALRASTEGGDRLGAAESELTIAVLVEATDPADSLARATRARAVFAESKATVYETFSLIVAGAAHSRLGDHRRTVESLVAAANMAREANLFPLEGEALAKLGEEYEDVGQFSLALGYYDRALRLAEAMGDQRTVVSRLAVLGSWSESIGQLGVAQKYYERALEAARLASDRAGEAGALQSLGVVLHRQGQSELGGQRLQEALAIYEEIGDKVGQARCLGSLGEAARDARDFDTARERLKKASSLFEEAGAVLDAATVTNSLGNLAFDEGDFELAARLFKSAFDDYEEQGARPFAATSLANRAEALYRQERYAEAEKDYTEALTRFEAVRIGLGDLTEAKASYLGRRAQVYQQFADVLTRLGRPNESFDVVQRMKARGLLDLLTFGRAVVETGMTDQERQTERELRARADELGARMLGEGVQNQVGAKKRYEALAKELREAERRLEEFTSTVYARRPGLKAARLAETTTAEEIGRLLPDDTALVEYAVSEYAINVMVLRKEGGVVRIDGSSRKTYLPDLRERASALRKAAATPAGQVDELAQGLYADLLAPVAKHLAGKKRIVVCPDGALWDVPFAVLMPAPGEYLVDRHEVAYAYSATGIARALAAPKGEKAPKELLVIANPDFGTGARFAALKLEPGERPIDTPSRPIDQPSRPIDQPSRPIDLPSRPIDQPSRPIDLPSRPIDLPSRAIDSLSRAIDSLSREYAPEASAGAIVPLPGTQREADELGRLFPGATLLVGTGAQEDRFKALAPDHRFIHLATHGFVNDASPLLSNVILAQPPQGSKEDGFLTAREINQLSLRAEMVVLSACNTARGEVRSGEGMVGLTWSLFVAGCPTQVVSQWAVNDASTADLMVDFYRNLAAGEGKGEALRAAILKLRKDKNRAHPYFWAPFVLIGDWR